MFGTGNSVAEVGGLVARAGSTEKEMPIKTAVIEAIRLWVRETLEAGGLNS